MTRASCMMSECQMRPLTYDRTCIQVPCILHRTFIFPAARTRELLFSFFFRKRKQKQKTRKTHNVISNTKNKTDFNGGKNERHIRKSEMAPGACFEVKQIFWYSLAQRF